jgi:radical SAM superfamily enzyme YgiQ (UPF0313 family)
MKIGYLTFGRDELSYGLALCLSRLKGHELYRVTPKTAREVDVLLFSIFWFEHSFLLAEFMRKAGIRKEQKKRPRIIIGGFNTFNPLHLLPYADAVVVGDGEDAIADVVEGNYDAPNVLTSAKEKVEWGIASLVPFCHDVNSIGRIELARGCKFGCRFCAVGHLKPYRELPIDGVKIALKTTKCKRVALFAPEPTIHKENDAITRLCFMAGKVRLDTDVRLDRIERRDGDAARHDSTPRVGIEGLSERLRKSVNKGYSHDFIVNKVKNFMSDGHKGLFMYFILDLPGEEDSDWSEFERLILAINELEGAEKFLLIPSPSVFMPTPGTPMALDGIHWERPYKQKWEGFFGKGHGRGWDVIMAERSRVFGPYMRLLQMMATRAGLEFREVEEELSASKGITIKDRLMITNKNAIESVLNRDSLIELYTGPRTGGPWDIVQFPEKGTT